jgi:hypothetical protein
MKCERLQTLLRFGRILGWIRMTQSKITSRLALDWALSALSGTIRFIRKTRFLSLSTCEAAADTLIVLRATQSAKTPRAGTTFGV